MSSVRSVKSASAPTRSRTIHGNKISDHINLKHEISILDKGIKDINKTLKTHENFEKENNGRKLLTDHEIGRYMNKLQKLEQELEEKVKKLSFFRRTVRSIIGRGGGKTKKCNRKRRKTCKRKK